MVEMQLIQQNELVYLEEELEQYIAAQPGRGPLRLGKPAGWWAFCFRLRYFKFKFCIGKVGENMAKLLDEYC